MNPRFKKTVASALAAGMLAGISLPTAAALPTEGGYIDVRSNSPYVDAIEALTASGAMSGTGSGKFSPNMNVTRAQVVTTLGRLAGATPSTTDSFSDVPANEWYAGYVGWAVENGIVQGDGRGHFLPDALVTSEHMNIILSNYAKLAGVTLDFYDTGGDTVTRADLAQRLYPFTPESVTALRAEQAKQQEDQRKLDEYDDLKAKAEANKDTEPTIIYRNVVGGSTTHTVYIDESMRDSEVLLPQRVHVTATGKAGCTAGESEAEHRAHTSDGWIMGYNDRGVYTFKGVNYATARRFENPKPAQYGRNGFSSLYSDDRDEPTLAMVRGAASPQAKTNTVYSDYFGFAYFMTPAGEDMFGRESDCLNLNIWTSSLNSNAKKPILVFMHGGGTDSDAATGLEVYEGRDFAEHNDIVFVTVNACLGTLGYNRDFTAIGGGNNLAVRDMLLSLEWIKENAATFGGDPDNITIAGQSGGGSKVSYLIDSKYADDNDLFQKVVATSASLGSNVSASSTQEVRNAATRSYVNTLKGRVGSLSNANDAQVLAYLQGVRSDELGTVLDGYSGGMTVDNYIFDDQSSCWGSDTVNARAAQYTYLIGNTWSEMIGADSIEVIQNNQYTRAKGYMSEDDKMELMEELYEDRPRTESNYYGMTRVTPASAVSGSMDEIRSAFHDLFPDHDFYDLRTLVAGRQNGFTRDNYYNSSMRVSAGQRNNNTGAKTYEYLMAYEFPYFGGTAMYHTGDLAFWFYSLANVRYQIAGDEETAYHVADYCANALANFCKTGDPSANGITWLPHEDGNPFCMIVDKNTRLVEGDYGEELIGLTTRVNLEVPVRITLGENGAFPADVNLDDVVVSYNGNYFKPNASDIDYSNHLWTSTQNRNNLYELRPAAEVASLDEVPEEVDPEVPEEPVEGEPVEGEPEPPEGELPTVMDPDADTNPVNPDGEPSEDAAGGSEVEEDDGTTPAPDEPENDGTVIGQESGETVNDDLGGEAA